MNWGSASEFFAMGGYGLFVWGSYGVSLLAMIAEPWLAARQHRRALASINEASYEEAASDDDAPSSRES